MSFSEHCIFHSLLIHSWQKHLSYFFFICALWTMKTAVMKERTLYALLLLLLCWPNKIKIGLLTYRISGLSSPEKNRETKKERNKKAKKEGKKKKKKETSWGQSQWDQFDKKGEVFSTFLWWPSKSQSQNFKRQ